MVNVKGGIALFCLLSAFSCRRRALAVSDVLLGEWAVVARPGFTHRQAVRPRRSHHLRGARSHRPVA
jgi:hypothetical protein